MTKDELIKIATQAGFWNGLGVDGLDELSHFAKLVAEKAIKETLAQPEQELVACVYKATTKKGDTAHFGEYSAAKAWAGWGTVEQVPLKTLTLIQKSIQPCSTCEALARTVMLDQTYHDTTPPQRTWVGLTEEEVDEIYTSVQEEVNKHWDKGGTTMMFPFTLYKAIEHTLKERNT
jgi:hypothetical protein